MSPWQVSVPPRLTRGSAASQRAKEAALLFPTWCERTDKPLPQHPVGDTQENVTGSGATLVCLTREVVSGIEEAHCTAFRRQRALTTTLAWLPDFSHGPPRLPGTPSLHTLLLAVFGL